MNSLDPGFWSGEPELKIVVFSLKLPEICMILEKILGARGPGPLATLDPLVSKLVH